MKRRFIPIVIGLLIMLLTLWLQLTNHPDVARIQSRIEHLFYDLALNLSAKSRPPSQVKIVIVDVDEKSIAQIARWPWPRRYMIDLVNRLYDGGAAVIAFDFVFSEPDINPVDTLTQAAVQSKVLRHDEIESLEKLRPLVPGDTEFAKALRKGNAILGMIIRDTQDELSKGALPSPVFSLDKDKNTGVHRFGGYLGNIKAVQDAASSTGFLTTIPDADGVIRRAPLLLRYNDNLYASLALQAARLYLLYDTIDIAWTQPNKVWQIESVRLGESRIYTDSQAKLMIPFRSSSRQYLTVSAADLLNGAVSKETFQNALVFVGSSASRFGDLHAVPMQPSFPGIEIQATIADSIISGQNLYSPSWSKGLAIVMAVILGIGLAVALPFLGASGILFIATTLLVLIIAAYYYLMHSHGLVFEITDLISLVFCTSIFNLGYGLFAEGGRRRQLKQLFGQYVPKEHVELMSEHPENYKGEGNTADLTVLFADIIGFTSIVEKLEPKDTRMLLNQFFTPMTRIIFENNGTVDKYVGDLLMAFWGAPLPDALHTHHALLAALAMREEVKHLKKSFKERGLPQIDIGIGLNTGNMLVGDMGSEYRRAYTVLGDAVNVASRIEGITRFYGVDILVGEACKEGQSDFIFKLIDRVKVKGRARPLEIFELVGKRDEISAELQAEIDAHERALSSYFEKDWATAKALFTPLFEQHPESKLYKIFLERIATLCEQSLPDTWDGAHQWILK